MTINIQMPNPILNFSFCYTNCPHRGSNILSLVSLPICNAPNEINTIFLYFLMSVLQNRCKSWQQIFDWWCHLVHTYWIQRGVFSFIMPFHFALEQACYQYTNVPITFTIALSAPSMLPSTSGYSSPRYSYNTTPKCPISFSYNQVRRFRS